MPTCATRRQSERDSGAKERGSGPPMIVTRLAASGGPMIVAMT